MGRTAFHNAVDGLLRHALSVILNADQYTAALFLLPRDRKPYFSLPVDVADSMVHCVFHHRLKDHAGHPRLHNRFIDLFIKMNVSRKSYIEDVNIILDRFYLLTQCGILAAFFYIVAEEVGHLLHKNARLLRIFQHGQLCAGVQRIEQEMRIDLRLQVLELCLLEVCLHQQLLLLHPLLLLHILAGQVHVFLEARYHGVEGPGHHSYLVQRIVLRHFDVEIAFADVLGSDSQIGERRDNSADHEEEHQDTDTHHNDKQYHTDHRERTYLALYRKKALRVVAELLIV